MSVFVSKVNASTGKVDWICKDEDYDYNQEIARSAYADMLHDTERNKKYELGLIAAVKSMRKQGRPCNVLDIGTGTGLLSMMAVRNGADTVHACDAFDPAAVCAEKIIEANGMTGKINLIRKRSTDMLVPEDMPIKANILITEVFDTELIGEGAIGTFRHALEYLLEPDCIVVPSLARMYIRPVESSYLNSRNQLSLHLPPDVSPVSMPDGIERYNNSLAAPLFDLQLSELPSDLFKTLAPPSLVFKFDFCGREPLPVEDKTVSWFDATASGTCHAFFMWWDLDMDMGGDVVLSCAPHWDHPDPRDTMQWRDHWMQAIFYPSRPLSVVKGSQYMIRSTHDEYSLCFDILEAAKFGSKGDTPVNKQFLALITPPDSATDMLHCVYTRSRLAMLSDKAYVSKYAAALNKTLSSKQEQETVALCASESSFLAFLLARLGVKKVLVLESNFIGARKITQSIIDHNNLTEVIQLYNGYDSIPQAQLQQVSLVVAEPYFSISHLPWDDLQLWYIRSSLTQPNITVCPLRAHLVALPVQFDNLHKIRSPLGTIEGLDLSIYDNMIETAREKSDDQWEPHSLWEYPCKALSQSSQIITFDLTKSMDSVEPESLSSKGEISILHDGEYNGVVAWMVYDLDDTNSVSFGSQGQITPGDYVTWHMERKQGVYLPLSSTAVESSKSKLQYTCEYSVKSGDMELTFTVT